MDYINNHLNVILWPTSRLILMSAKVLSLSQDQYHKPISIVIGVSHDISLGYWLAETILGRYMKGYVKCFYW